MHSIPISPYLIVSHFFFSLFLPCRSKIADDVDIGAVTDLNEKARDELESKLSVVCAYDGAKKGTGLGKLADELVDSMTATFGKSSNKAEELRNTVAQLNIQVNSLTINLDTTTKGKFDFLEKISFFHNNKNNKLYTKTNSIFHSLSSYIYFAKKTSITIFHGSFYCIIFRKNTFSSKIEIRTIKFTSNV